VLAGWSASLKLSDQTDDSGQLKLEFVQTDRLICINLGQKSELDILLKQAVAPGI
jgi:hypothetical protein